MLIKNIYDSNQNKTIGALGLEIRFDILKSIIVDVNLHCLPLINKFLN